MPSPLIKRLVDAFCCLPGVGARSAQRMAYHLLERDRNGGKLLADTIAEAMAKIRHCNSCRDFTEHEVCEICRHPGRDESLLCVVESPADILAIEQTAGYRGRYFVLMGHLSPLDGIGPSDLGLDILKERASKSEVKELILATNSTVEGEATAHFISDMVRPFGVKVTRIAHGVPLGGELEYIDGGTLAHSLAGRQPYN